jgi:Zn-dependent peptidase ImmA (M78 family)
VDADREMVGIVRKLGFHLHQLNQIQGKVNSQFEHVFRTVLDRVDKSAPPGAQGRAAAQEFRAVVGLNQGQQGIGELIRPRLRQLGVLVIESPLPKSDVEGCSFRVLPGRLRQPCLFANTYKSTWFRRNWVILHELAHAVFDHENDEISLDFKEDSSLEDLRESRAEAFAQECLVPRSVLVHFQNQFGLSWDRLNEGQLALLMANTHTEQRAILKAAADAEFISGEDRCRYSKLDCHSELLKLTDRALTTSQYLRKLHEESPVWRAENRNTTISVRRLRLPSGYVDQVLKAYAAKLISFRKVAEMLMMDQATVSSRFGVTPPDCYVSGDAFEA